MRHLNFFRWFVLLFIIQYSSVSFSSNIDPLPSWYPGFIKQNIINFIQAVTDKKSKDYVSPEDRIATFDNDGTLWVEQPLYPQMLLC